MFSITDNERLRDAYALLMFMQRDISASAEKKAAVKNLAATVKMEIRAYNNRPVSNVRIISADYDGRLELVQLPDELDKAHKADAANWFRDNCYCPFQRTDRAGLRRQDESYHRLRRRDRVSSIPAESFSNG